MGTFDEMKGKAKDLARDHADQVDQGIDKAGDFADEKTGGKHSDKIEQTADKAGDAVDRFAEAYPRPAGWRGRSP